MTRYDAENITAYYDEFAEQEWERMVANPVDEVSLFIHNHYLHEWVSRKDKVLEIGAGPGRFTQELARLAGELTVTDISPVQLELNKCNARDVGFAEGVTDWDIADITDLQQFENESFDGLVAYGGPLSYTLEQRAQALLACRRVLRPGGYVLMSVMSLWGSMHRHLGGVLQVPMTANQAIVATGDLTQETFPERDGHFMHMFRAAELRQLFEDNGFSVRQMSASNFLSVGWAEELAKLKQAGQWQAFLQMELEACREEQSLNMGTHTIVVAQRA